MKLFESDQLVSSDSRELIAQQESVLKVRKVYSDGLKQREVYIEHPLKRTQYSIRDIITQK